jgi:hypothetical protein
MIDKNVINIFFSFLVVFVFMLGMVNFVIMFPKEQGFTLQEKDNITWAELNKSMVQNAKNVNTNLEGYVNTSDGSFEQWDIEVGFMGSNTLKKIKDSLTGYTSEVMKMIGVIINQLFNSNNLRNHPIFIIFDIISIGLIVLVIYIVVKYIRTGI